MSFNIEALAAEAKAVINEATGPVDLADKWANRVRPLLAELPVVGPEASTIVSALDAFDKALDELKNILGNV